MNKLKTHLSIFLLLTITLLSGVMAETRQTTGKAAPPDNEFNLIMFEELGCTYCDLWNEQVGVSYAKTPEGRFAPLTRVEKGDPDVEHIKRVIYTPTFVVMRGNKEVGRILGYPGEEFFWVYLGEILEKAGFKPAS